MKFEKEITDEILKSKAYQDMVLNGFSPDEANNILNKSWSTDLMKQFPNGQWRTINGAKVFINNGKVIAGLDNFNGMIDDFFKEKNKKESKPKVLELTEGKKWNGKIYGNEKRGYSIYVNGSKVEISKQDKETYEKYIEQRNKKLKEKKEQEIKDGQNSKNVKLFPFSSSDIKSIINKLQGKKWNGKIYGKNSIYLDGNKVELNDKEVEILQSYNKLNDYPVLGSYDKNNLYDTISGLDHYSKHVDVIEMISDSLKDSNKRSSYKIDKYEIMEMLPNITVNNYTKKDFKIKEFKGDVYVLELKHKGKFLRGAAFLQGKNSIGQKIERKQNLKSESDLKNILNVIK